MGGGENDANGGIDEPDDGGVGVRDWFPMYGPGDGEPEGL